MSETTSEARDMLASRAKERCEGYAENDCESTELLFHEWCAVCMARYGARAVDAQQVMIDAKSERIQDLMGRLRKRAAKVEEFQAALDSAIMQLRELESERDRLLAQLEDA